MPHGHFPLFLVNTFAEHIYAQPGYILDNMGMWVQL